MLLLRKHLSRQNILIQEMSSLDLLYLTANKGTGALTYRPVRQEQIKQVKLSLDKLEKEVQNVLENDSNIDIKQLFNITGSPGGARPKIHVLLNTETNKLYSENHEINHSLEAWIVKFSAETDALDSAHTEFAYNLMASDCGNELSPFKLFEDTSGKSYFGSKRFDITANNKLHVVTAAAVTHDDFERSTLDYGHLLDATQRLTSSALEVEKMFRLACFNVLAHNRDDHSKNFSFLMDKKGEWKLSPVYDLTFSSSSQGMHSTSCAGNSVNPGETELMELAKTFSIKNGRAIFNSVTESISKWRHFSKQANVSAKSMQLIERKIVK